MSSMVSTPSALTRLPFASRGVHFPEWREGAHGRNLIALNGRAKGEREGGSRIGRRPYANSKISAWSLAYLQKGKS